MGKAFVAVVRVEMAPDCALEQARRTIGEELAHQFGPAALVLEVREEGSPRQPMQPIEWAEENVVRFRKNQIVDYLVDWARGRGMGLNEIAVMHARGYFNSWDLMQLDQLIGYSVAGYGDLSYVDRDQLADADRVVDALAKRGE